MRTNSVPACPSHLGKTLKKVTMKKKNWVSKKDRFRLSAADSKKKKTTSSRRRGPSAVMLIVNKNLPPPSSSLLLLILVLTPSSSLIVFPPPHSPPLERFLTPMRRPFSHGGRGTGSTGSHRRRRQAVPSAQRHNIAVAPGAAADTVGHEHEQRGHFLAGLVAEPLGRHAVVEQVEARTGG